MCFKDFAARVGFGRAAHSDSLSSWYQLWRGFYGPVSMKACMRSSRPENADCLSRLRLHISRVFFVTPLLHHRREYVNEAIVRTEPACSEANLALTLRQSFLSFEK